MCYTYNNGYREGVIFAFLKNKSEVLIEKRKLENNDIDIFFTSGSIEKKDYINTTNYKENALFREVKEEFKNKITIKEYVYLNEVKAKPVKLIFYVYLITNWIGEMPDYTFEDGKDDAKLEWIHLRDKNKYFRYETAFEICTRIEEYLLNNRR